MNCPSRRKRPSVTEELVQSLSALILIAEETVKDIGGCDHSVGICCCDYIGTIKRAKFHRQRAESRLRAQGRL